MVTMVTGSHLFGGGVDCRMHLPRTCFGGTTGPYQAEMRCDLSQSQRLGFAVVLPLRRNEMYMFPLDT